MPHPETIQEVTPIDQLIDAELAQFLPSMGLYDAGGIALRSIRADGSNWDLMIRAPREGLTSSSEVDFFKHSSWKPQGYSVTKFQNHTEVLVTDQVERRRALNGGFRFIRVGEGWKPLDQPEERQAVIPLLRALNAKAAEAKGSSPRTRLVGGRGLLKVIIGAPREF